MLYVKRELNQTDRGNSLFKECGYIHVTCWECKWVHTCYMLRM